MRKRDVGSKLAVSPETNEEVRRMIELLESFTSAPVFNGGFSRLYQKVENIDQKMSTMGEAMDKLNAAVFDPKAGLFVVVDKEKVENDHDFEAFDKRLDDLEVKISSYRKFVIGIFVTLATGAMGGGAKLLWDLISTHITYH